MRIQSDFGRRVGQTAGIFCVLASFALLPSGVRTARAGDAPLMTVDPGGAAPAQAAADRVTAPAAPAAAASPSPSPIVHVDDVENARRPGVSGIEIAPGVIVLNTRGFNYGPPPTPLAPEAIQQESASPAR